METLRIKHRCARGHRVWPLYSRRDAGQGHPTLHELLQSVKRRQLNYPLPHKINLGSGPLAKLIADETSGQSRQLRQERQTEEGEELYRGRLLAALAIIIGSIIT